MSMPRIALAGLALLILFLPLPLCLGQEEETHPLIEEIALATGRSPKGLAIVDFEGEVLWQPKEQTGFGIRGVVGSMVQLECPIGEVRTDLTRFGLSQARAHQAFVGLTALAEKASFGSGDYEFRYEPMVGFGLQSEDNFLTADGVYVIEEATEDWEDKPIEELEGAIQQVRTLVRDSSLSELGQATVESLLDLLLEPDGDREMDEIQPSFARMLIRNGWLEQAGILEPSQELNELATSTAKAEQVMAGSKIHSHQKSITRLLNRFGQGGWLRREGESQTLGVVPPRPMYYGLARLVLGHSVLEYDLPPDVNPQAGTNLIDSALAIRLVYLGQTLAQWSPTEGFQSDPAIWREFLPAKGAGLEKDIVSNYFPPHIVASRLGGEVDRLLTDRGSLSPPANTNGENTTAFLSQAAEVLPGAADLDLIGQYFFAYVYDSPDSESPYLVGNREVKGEIHQTALQTLQTAIGGICRGDCDDLSELYTEIVGLQGKIAYVINLPLHAAAAWAEKRGENWHTFVMQTGPTLEFVDPELSESLQKAYIAFDETESFDPNYVGLLLRFSGENTRSSWGLSHRIFADEEYAKTMIDVQRDWHFQTYLQGIRKMEALISSGDEDSANFRELAGLYSFTGQYDLAVEYHEKAMEQVENPELLLYMNQELLNYLLDAEDDTRVQELAQMILKRHLPLVAKDLNHWAIARLHLDISSALIQSEDYELATFVLANIQQEFMSRLTYSTINYLNSEKFSRTEWEASEGIRRILRRNAGICLLLLKEVGLSEIDNNPLLGLIAYNLQQYLDAISMHDVWSQKDVATSYSVIGRFYEMFFGEEEFWTRLESVSAPSSPKEDHTNRLGGLAQIAMDLPWIKVSVSYWATSIFQRFDEDAPTPAPDELRRLLRNMESAIEASRQVGLYTARTEHTTHMARLAVAMVTEDAATLRQLLERVKRKDDKNLRDSTAQWMGVAARHTNLEWYEKAIDAWREIVDYKPKYYWIAWQAAVHEAPEHALLVAKVAADRFQDDQTFVEEYEYMRQLFE